MGQRFIAEQGELKGQVISFDEGDSWVFGSDSAQSQVVINDTSIAGIQFLIKRTSEGVILENLSIDHPTIVNDQAIGASSTLLKSGDTIRLGGELFRFEETTTLDKKEEEFISAALTEILNEGDHETVDPAAKRQPVPESPEPKEESEPYEEDTDLLFDEEMLNEEEPQEEQNMLKDEELQEERKILDEPQEERKILDEPQEEQKILEEEPHDEQNMLKEEELQLEEKDEHLPSEEEHLQETEELTPDDDKDLMDEDEDLIFDEGMLHETEPQGDKTISEEEGHTVEKKEENPLEEEDLQHEETIFSDEIGDATLAEIDFGVIETGRWLLKVVGGPNTGAEFYMQAGTSYVLGTDPINCDIVFQDTSVSRQHAKITVTPEDSLVIDDLKSRNGVLINGELIKEQLPLDPNTIVTIGTTSFAIYDREGEMQTIISPLLPSIVKSLQKEEHPRGEEGSISSESVDKEVNADSQPFPSESVQPPPQPQRNYGSMILLAVVIGLFVLAGIGTTALFQVQQVVVSPDKNVEADIKQTLSPYTALRYSYNSSTGSLLLIGHVVSIADKNHIIYKLQEIRGIKSIDDKGMIIDELAWNEVNTVLSDNPNWKGISLHAPEAGQFVLTGYLKTRKQAEELASYIGRNFPYLDSLKKQVVIEEDLVQSANSIVAEKQLLGVHVKINNGEVTLSGEVPTGKNAEVQEVISQIKQIPGVRIVYNQVISQNPEKVGIINLTDQYQISGKSQIGNKYTVLIHGKLLSEGDVLDGMDITKMTNNAVFLERGDKKYRIDY